MAKLVTFGEIMMRLNPVGYYRFVQANQFEVSYSGGEANVAVAVAQLGIDASFITKVPHNELGQAAVNSLRQFGVETSKIQFGGPRLGVYFVEKGASQRASKVIYDRTGSSIALADRADFDWEEILAGAEWFHFTGITPALGGNLPDICLDAVQTARRMGVTVSCDLNYRKKLWSRQEAQTVMSTLMPYVDICIANEEDAKDVFNISAERTDLEKGVIDQAGYVSVARQLTDRFGFAKVAITLRGSKSASNNSWAGMLYSSQQAYFSPSYDIQIVDRVGSGDSFGGALIYALLQAYEPQAAIQFAVAASCLKHTIEHDFNLVSLDEVAALAAGNTSGRVQR